MKKLLCGSLFLLAIELGAAKFKESIVHPIRISEEIISNYKRVYFFDTQFDDKKKFLKLKISHYGDYADQIACVITDETETSIKVTFYKKDSDDPRKAFFIRPVSCDLADVVAGNKPIKIHQKNKTQLLISPVHK